MKFYFNEKLKEGLIIKRKNRFIIEVLIDNKIETCHCPCTTNIYNLNIENIPCLYSYSNDLKRKTKYTIEAISLNKIKDKNKYWIGINQIFSNKIINFCIQNNQLEKIININNNDKILREFKINDSKLDFFVKNTFIEVKTPMVLLPLNKNYLTNTNLKFKNNNNNIIQSKEFSARFIKHINQLISVLKNNQKAIILTVFLFQADKFVPPEMKDNIIFENVLNAKKSGVEFWQVNFKFDTESIELWDYYRILE